MQVSGYLLEEMLKTLRALEPLLAPAKKKGKEYGQFVSSLQTCVSAYKEKLFGPAAFGKYDSDVEARAIIDALEALAQMPHEKAKAGFTSLLADLRLLVDSRESVDSSHTPGLPFKDYRHTGQSQKGR